MKDYRRLEANEFLAIFNSLGAERTRYVANAVNSHADLLAAAEAALDLLTSEYQQGINNGYWPNVAPIVHNLEAAIAKAKGR